MIKYLVKEIKLDPTYLPEEGITTPLHEAAFYGNLAAIQLFLEYGADPNLKDEAECTTIDILKKRGFRSLIPLVELLIAAHKHDYDACYNVAQLYFSGENSALKKDFHKAIYYIEKGLNGTALSEEKREELEVLKNQIESEIKQIAASTILSQNNPSPVSSSKKVTHQTTSPSTYYSLTDFFINKVNPCLPTIPSINSKPPLEDKQLLINKKNQ